MPRKSRVDLSLPDTEEPIPTADDVAREARRDLIIALLVTAVGLSALSFSWLWMSWAQFVDFAVSHISVGTFVAGLVGIAYELRAPSRHLRIANRHLRIELRRLVDVKNALAAKDLLPVLEAIMLRDPADATHVEIVQSIKTLVSSIQALDAVHWENNAISATTISVLLKYASDAAETLAKMKGGGKYPLLLPVSAAEVADKILAQQTLAMRDGDSYSVVSDMSTWVHSRLPEFWNATKFVVNNRDVTIRRLFARFPHDKRITRVQARALLRKHLDLSGGRPTLTKTLKHPFRARHNWDAYQVGILADPSLATHVGVFKYGKGAIMCFEPQPGGLSRIDISVVESDPFDPFWQQAVKSREGEDKRDFEAFAHEITERAPQWWRSFRLGVPTLGRRLAKRSGTRDSSHDRQ